MASCTQHSPLIRHENAAALKRGFLVEAMVKSLYCNSLEVRTTRQGMVGQVLRLCLISLLLISMGLPRVTAAVAAFIPGAQTLVICAGGSLMTVTVNGAGDPVEMPEPVADHCLLADTTPVDAASPSAWQRLPRSFTTEQVFTAAPVAKPARIAAHRLSRAPPFVV